MDRLEDIRRALSEVMGREADEQDVKTFILTLERERWTAAQNNVEKLLDNLLGGPSRQPSR